MEPTKMASINGKGKEKEMMKEIPGIKWDFVKAVEPGHAKDAKENHEHTQKLLGYLAEGFEPFAVVPMMKKASNFSQDFETVIWIYLKRPSMIVEAIDDSEKVIRP